MPHVLRKTLLTSACLYFFCFNGFTQTNPHFSVRQIGCPNPCRGETVYKIVFSSSAGTVVTVNEGTILKDTIYFVPSANYFVVVTTKNTSGIVSEEKIVVPICDPIIPRLPVAANQIVCEGSTMPILKAIVTSANSTVDWYEKPLKSSAKLATGTLSYQPKKAGTFYILARNVSDCTSQFVAVTVSTVPVICAILTTKKQRF